MKTMKFTIDKKRLIKLRNFSSIFFLVLSLSACTPSSGNGTGEATSTDLVQETSSYSEASPVRGSILSAVPDNTYIRQTSPQGRWCIYISADENDTAFYLMNEPEHLIYSYDMGEPLVRAVFNESETDAALFFEEGPEFYTFQVIDLKKQEVSLNQSIFQDPSFYSRLGTKEKVMYMENPRSWPEEHLLIVDILFDYYEGYPVRGQYTYNFITGKIENLTTESTMIETDIKNMRNTLEHVSLEDLTSDEVTDAEEWDGISFPLIAAIPDKDIFLYGLHNELHKGVVLRYHDTLQTFEWDYMVRDTLPEMSLYDIDQDEQDELIVITHVGAGTGISVSELHILELEEDGSYRDIMFEEKDYISQLYAKIHYDYDSISQVLRVTAGEQTYDIPVKDFLFADEVIPEPFIFKPDYSSVALFEFDNRIHLLVSPDAYINEVFTSGSFLDIIAEVEYNGKEFTLKNFTFES